MMSNVSPATFHALYQHIHISPDGQATVIWKNGNTTTGIDYRNEIERF